MSNDAYFEAILNLNLNLNLKEALLHSTASASNNLDFLFRLRGICFPHT